MSVPVRCVLSVDFSLLPSSSSPELLAVLHRLLDKNPATRVTLPELFHDPWVTQCGAAPLVQVPDPTADGTIAVSADELAAAVTPLTRIDLLASLKLRMRRHVAKRRTSRKLSAGAPGPVAAAPPAAIGRPRKASLHAVQLRSAPTSRPGSVGRRSRAGSDTDIGAGAGAGAGAGVGAGAGAGAGAGVAPPALPRPSGRDRRRPSLAHTAAQSKAGFVRTVGEAGRQLLNSALHSGDRPKPVRDAVLAAPSSKTPPASRRSVQPPAFQTATSDAEVQLLGDIGSKLFLSSMYSLGSGGVGES